MKRDRYKGKPLLILLENYVLDCIGLLPAEKIALTTDIVQRVYGGGDDWKVTLRATLHLGDGFDDNLRELWERNQGIARKAGRDLSPKEFAHMIVDENFRDLID